MARKKYIAYVLPMINAENIQLGTIGALAYAGDLSMGQPSSHSPRVALLAGLLLGHFGLHAHISTTTRLALLRWCGCTANAAEFNDLFGDDIAHRASLLATQNQVGSASDIAAKNSAAIYALSRMHCETGSMLVRRLALQDDMLLRAFNQLAEIWDGSGYPLGLEGDKIAVEAQAVSIASDLEIWSRVHGLQTALDMLKRTASARHDPKFVAEIIKHGSKWIENIAHLDPWTSAAQMADIEENNILTTKEAVFLLCDYADLKQPNWQRLGRRTAALLKRANADERTVYAGALVTLGWVGVPNNISIQFKPLEQIYDESCRLVPHWTARCLSRMPPLKPAADIAKLSFERANGTGFPMELTAKQMSHDNLLLQAAIIGAWSGADALIAASEQKLVCDKAARQILRAINRQSPEQAPMEDHITPREKQVLNGIVEGLSNKEIALKLAISPSTAGTHVENLYRKLEVRNRATATLKALELGIIQ